MLDIKKHVDKLIKTYETRDPYTISRYMGINVLYKPYSDGTKGYCKRILRNDFIVINSRAPEHEKTIINGHELGHIILHKNLNIGFIREYTLFPVGKYEIQANKFAAELIIDDSCFELAMDTKMTIDQLGIYYGVPSQLIKYKFSKLT